MPVEVSIREQHHSKSICIEDFCGYSELGHFPIQYWADWNPDTMLVTFGGDWAGIPQAIWAVQPTAEEVNNYAKAWMTILENVK